MRNYRPLLIENPGVRLPGIEVKRFRLHRHTSEPRLTSHAHSGFDQVIAYLAGRGRQRILDRFCEVAPGSVFFIPAKTAHAFEREKSQRPLCVVLDLRIDAAFRPADGEGRLAAGPLAQLKGRISELLAPGRSTEGIARIKTGAIILDLAADFLAGLAGAKVVESARGRAITRRVKVLLERDATASPEEIAGILGWHRDHLNRLLKEECGLTLGRLRDGIRLRKAQRILHEGVPVQEAGMAVGILDNNYFARWFRKQTGMSPTRWRARR